jgi:peptidoglycan/xylan/chitin deacetylase (PgdA/CDA1 family)
LRSIPVLLYHSVSDIEPADRFSVSPPAFEEHLAAIVECGRVPMTITELADGLRGELPLPERCFALTFDDGYSDTIHAMLAAASRALKSTLYVTAGAVDSARGVSRADLIALAAMQDRVELGAHTISHPRLDELPDSAVRDELVGSREMLEAIVERCVLSFAYPHGAYDGRVRQAVINAGYRSAVGVKNALSHDRDDPWAIARVTVLREHRAEDVAAMLDGAGWPVAWSRERIRTRAYRTVRRVRRSVVRYARG